MRTALEALGRAVIDSPEDRTVRLVYADALDETGEAADAARAAFIRGQIKLEAEGGLAPGAGERLEVLLEEFTAYWLDWWRPVAAAAGLPEPHRSRQQLRRVRDRVVERVTGRPPRRPANWPYSFTSSDASVHLADYGMSVRFAAGFPEEVRFLNLDTPDGGPELVHRWGDALPLVRLAFAYPVTPEEWARVDGPHLARLPELTFDRLTFETAPVVAVSPNLEAVTRLTANVVGSNPETVVALVLNPSWQGLRTLRFTGRLSLEAVGQLARLCNLVHLEELEIAIGNPSGLGSPLGDLLNQFVRSLTQLVGFPAALATRWAEYGPSFEALAAAPWVRGLRRLSVTTGGSHDLLNLLGTPPAGDAANVIPDAAVLALAESLAPDKLDSLVLPAAVVGPHAREALAARLGTRVAFE